MLTLCLFMRIFYKSWHWREKSGFNLGSTARFKSLKSIIGTKLELSAYSNTNRNIKQYYEFKVLHKTEMRRIRFSTAFFPENQLFWCKLLKNVKAPIETFLLTPLKLNFFNCVFQNQQFNFLENCDYSQLWSKTSKNFSRNFKDCFIRKLSSLLYSIDIWSAHKSRLSNTAPNKSYLAQLDAGWYD